MIGFAQFKEILRKKTVFRVHDRPSCSLRHRLLLEYPVNLKLFGDGLYDTDDKNIRLKSAYIWDINLQWKG